MSFNFKELIVLRHGECQHNVATRYAGQSDSPLTLRGRQQASAAASLLKLRVPEVERFKCISSPLSRARDTAEIVLANLGMDHHAYMIDDRLLELNFGDHTNQLVETVQALLAKNVPLESMWRYSHPNGESAAELYERIGVLLAKLASPSLLVCHSGTARMIRAHMLSLTPLEALNFKLENGSCLIYRTGTEEKILNPI